MAIHTRKEILKAADALKGRGNKQVIFSCVFRNTGGAARRGKLEKAWLQLRTSGRLISDKNRKRFAVVPVPVEA
jgi:hypothetical protein